MCLYINGRVHLLTLLQNLFVMNVTLHDHSTRHGYDPYVVLHALMCSKYGFCIIISEGIIDYALILCYL